MTRIAITPGEPAGIGPDLVVEIFQRERDFDAIVIADEDVLAARADQLGFTLTIEAEDTRAGGRMTLLPVPASVPVVPGQLDINNAAYVLQTLQTGVDGCVSGVFDALVTGPVQKSVVNESGTIFTGHTEFLRKASGVEDVVMVLVVDTLKVALATTHVPLAQVASLITRDLLQRKLEILVSGLESVFGIRDPCIAVSGLNPHAGEGGHLGLEEIEVIEPVCRAWRESGARIKGPLPADTLFNHLDGVDAVLVMYHDQGLPVLKYIGFGQAVNVTLGLPFLRTSVDHGTALDLAGSGQAELGSLRAALELAARA